MDIKKLYSDIQTALPSDPEAVAGMQHVQKGHNQWTIDDSGLLRLDDRIFVPSANDLHLQVCKHHHDHILASHFGQNRMLAIIWCSYTWPQIWDFVKDYVRSCTDCGRNKSRQHRPYRMLKPLPVPTQPWDSISLDFIEQLPDSNGHTAILIIIDRISPFFTNKGYHPNITVHLEYHLTSQKAHNYVSNLDDVHQFLHDKIKAAQEAYKTMADNRQKSAPDFQVGQQVYILAKHIKMTQPMKLSEKYLGPYTIIAQPSSNAFTI
uniref:Putative reverse transcriptase-RNaseH-integrase n=1 Tax=Moniliophthora roreri TaxID=221103 RepID=A0A0W0F6I6_MONRR